jgi:hypothetical protein
MDKGKTSTEVKIERKSSMATVAQTTERRKSIAALEPPKKKPITLESLTMSATSACAPKKKAPPKDLKPDEDWHMFVKGSLMTKLKTNETQGLSTTDAKACLRVLATFRCLQPVHTTSLW